MNDFTKDELRELGISLRATGFTPYLSTMFKEESMALLDKIQSMINNYCEHASLEETDMRKCFKCGALFP